MNRAERKRIEKGLGQAPTSYQTVSITDAVVDVADAIWNHLGLGRRARHVLEAGRLFLRSIDLPLQYLGFVLLEIKEPCWRHLPTVSVCPFEVFAIAAAGRGWGTPR